MKSKCPNRLSGKASKKNLNKNFVINGARAVIAIY